MRIAAISNSRIPSSTANSIQAMKMCDALGGLGHEVRLSVPAETEPVDWIELERKYGVSHHFEIEWLPSRRGLRRLDFIWLARRNARRFRADIVYTWLPQTAALEAWRQSPTILEMHADVAGAFGAWWLRRAMGSRNTRLLVTTMALRAALERSTRMVFSDAGIVVAPNGVDLERYEDLPDPPGARAALHLPERLTVGFTGHFYQGRGIDLLWELAQRLPNVQFLWVGGTPDVVDDWRVKLTSARVSNVILTGFIDNNRLPMYQAAADILLMPYETSVSASSGQDIAEVINPMKMYEYMAARRPIITADLPVIHEVLDPTRAVFCQPGVVEDWDRAIIQLAGDNARRRMLGENARREVEQYTWIRRAHRALQNMDAH